jgi:hypothetical protein
MIFRACGFFIAWRGKVGIINVPGFNVRGSVISGASFCW